MSDKYKDLCGLLSAIEHRRVETKRTDRQIKKLGYEMFDEQQTNIEKIRHRAKKGDRNAEAAYMALLRGRRMLPP